MKTNDSTESSLKVNQSYIPSSYEDLYLHYFADKVSLGRQLVRHFIKFTDAEEFEDLVNDSFTRMIGNRILEKFNPEKANFGGAVFFCVRSACVNHLSRRSREPLTGLRGGSIVEDLDSDVPSHTYALSLGMYLESKAPSIEGVLIAEQEVSILRAYVKRRKEKNQNKRDRCISDLVDLLYEGYTELEAAEKLGVTLTTIRNWMKWLAVTCPFTH